MSDAFGKVISFIIVAILLFVVPIRIAGENQKISEKMYLYTEAAAVCEQIRNTGVITDDTYEGLYRVASGILTVCEIELWSVNGENVLTISEDIVKQIETEGRYKFSQGDYIRISIKNSEGVQVYCGGMIKYNETD